MADQNFSNHQRVVPMFHRVLLPIFFLTFIGSCVNLGRSLSDHQRLYSAALILVLTLCSILSTLFARMFALKAQDRAIRVEENLRHYVLTGKLLDPRITIQQAIALRFAPDGEFPALAKRAADEGLAPIDVKKSIREWRADEYRV
jgi:Family of unknown function (DUF6526)